MQAQESPGNSQRWFVGPITPAVSVSVTVKDQSGRPLQGLTPADFTIYEDGVPQELMAFSAGYVPVSAAIVVDANLQGKRLDEVADALSALVRSLDQSDEVDFFRYGSSTEQVSAFATAGGVSSDVFARLKQPIANQGAQAHAAPNVSEHPAAAAAPGISNSAPGSAVLNDAILLAAQELTRRNWTRRRIMVVIGDGREQGSTARYNDVRKVLLSQNISVYAITIDIKPVYDQLTGRVRAPGFGLGDFLPKYSSSTGGEVFVEFNKEGIEQAYKKIIDTTHKQYTLTYKRKPDSSGSYHFLDVHVHRPSLTIIAKSGYYPPPEER